MDTEIQAEQITTSTDLEPLDYTRDWSKEMRSTCADILLRLRSDLDSSNSPVSSYDTSTSSISGWTTTTETRLSI
eukprot:scaffold5358_cov225-Chaetoceros_neogracile.AAC.6